MEVWTAHVTHWRKLDTVLLCLCWLGLLQAGTVVYVKETGEDPEGRTSTEGQPSPAMIGETPPKCMYSFVVNELDSSKCPMLFQNMPSMQVRRQTSHKLRKVQLQTGPVCSSHHKKTEVQQ